MSSLLNTTAKKTRYALISLGSNQVSRAGSALKTLHLAARDLSNLSLKPSSLSSMYRTEPIDCAPGTQDFINGAMQIHIAADMDPLRLLELLHEIEANYGRVRLATVNAPRPLDLDLISIEGIELSHASLTLPHPRAAERLFVLAPLAEIDPNLTLCAGGSTVAGLIKNLGPSPAVERVTLSE